MDLNGRLKWLKGKGCFPSIYLRGEMWRVHINSGGNFWGDAETPQKAMDMAVDLWTKKGCPMDGLGKEVVNGKI